MSPCFLALLDLMAKTSAGMLRGQAQKMIDRTDGMSQSLTTGCPLVAAPGTGGAMVPDTADDPGGPDTGIGGATSVRWRVSRVHESPVQ